MILTAMNTDSEFKFFIGPVLNLELLNGLQQMKSHVGNFDRVLMPVSDW